MRTGTVAMRAPQVPTDYTSREGVVLPNDYRRAPQFCGNVADRVIDQPLRLAKGAAHALLALPNYKQADTFELIQRAQKHLQYLRRRGMVAVTDRATAIAVLEGIR